VNSLTIARHQITYLASSALMSEELRQRLDRVMARELPTALAQQLAAYARADENGLWLIRRLDLEVSLLDISTPDTGTLARVWAQEATRALRQQVAGGSDGQNVLYFPNRAAYVAQFIADLLDGVAWKCWYYAPFDGLCALPTAEAARQALLMEEDQAEEALLHLARAGRLPPVLSALRTVDCTSLLKACRNRASALAPALSATIDELLALWPVTDLRPQPRWASDLNRLRLWLAWRVAHPGVTPSRHLLPAAEQLLQLADRLHDLSLANSPALDQSQRQEDWLARAVAIVAPQAAAKVAGGRGVTEFTPYGALFLLLPSMIDLGLHQTLATALNSAEIERTTAAIWRAWLGCKCLGRERWAQARQSALVWQVMGLDGPPDEQQWQAAGEAATPALREQWRQTLLATLQRQGKLGRHTLALEKVATESYPQEVWLVRDMLYDYWLLATTTPPETATLEAEAPGAYFWRPTINDEPDDPSVAPFLRQGKAAAPLLDYLALTPALPLELELSLSVAAAAVLRSFARRLPGFNWSGFDHLYRNFLAGESRIRFTTSEVLVELPRSPLHSILRMAGFDGHQYTVPWLDERTVVLQLPDGI
jgi:hypothetical protein